MYVSSVQEWHHRAIDIVCFLFPLFLLFVCVFVNSLALAFLVASFLASGLSAHALGGIALHTHSSSHPLVSPVVSALAFVEHDIKLDSKKKKVLDRRTGPICAAMAQCKVVDLAVLAYSDSELSGASQPQSLLRHVESISLQITGLGLAAASTPCNT